MPLLNTDIPTALAPYLLPGERVVAAVHHHWARVAEPVASAVLSLVVVLWIESNVTVSTQGVMTPLWLGFWFLVGRAGWNLLEWRHDWFVATDKRLLLRHGLVTHKVAMMPLLKVTDMSYVRSVPGQLLGYGRFIMESAGQDQALHLVNWVPRPDETYRAICAEIFHIDASALPGAPGFHERGAPDGEVRGPRDAGHDLDPGLDPDLDPGLDEEVTGHAGFGSAPYPDVPPIRDPLQDRLDSWSRAMPVSGGERFYASDDLLDDERGPATGPVPRPRRRGRPEDPGT
jgi:hypothetical protein